MLAEALLVVMGTGQPSLPSHPLRPQAQTSCKSLQLFWLHCGGDLGGGKAKGRGHVGWSELCLVPDTPSPPWHEVAGNTLLLICTRAISVFAEQNGFLLLPSSQGAVNDCQDDRDFCLLSMGQSGLWNSVLDSWGGEWNQKTSFVTDGERVLQ